MRYRPLLLPLVLAMGCIGDKSDPVEDPVDTAAITLLYSDSDVYL